MQRKGKREKRYNCPIELQSSFWNGRTVSFVRIFVESAPTSAVCLSSRVFVKKLLTYEWPSKSERARVACLCQLAPSRCNRVQESALCYPYATTHPYISASLVPPGRRFGHCHQLCIEFTPPVCSFVRSIQQEPFDATPRPHALSASQRKLRATERRVRRLIKKKTFFFLLQNDRGIEDRRNVKRQGGFNRVRQWDDVRRGDVKAKFRAFRSSLRKSFNKTVERDAENWIANLRTKRTL